MAFKALSGVVRCSQKQSIIPLLKVCMTFKRVLSHLRFDLCENQNRFIGLVREARLPSRQDPGYAEKLRLLHSGILGLCALIESFPYSAELMRSWSMRFSTPDATRMSTPGNN